MNLQSLIVEQNVVHVEKKVDSQATSSPIASAIDDEGGNTNPFFLLHFCRSLRIPCWPSTSHPFHSTLRILSVCCMKCCPKQLASFFPSISFAESFGSVRIPVHIPLLEALRDLDKEDTQSF